MTSCYRRNRLRALEEGLNLGSGVGTTSPFKPGRMNGRFPPIRVTSLSGQHDRFEDVGPLS